MFQDTISPAAMAEALSRSEDYRVLRRLVPRAPSSDRVNSAAFSRGGERLLCGTEDGKLILWDTTYSRSLHAFQAHSTRLTSVALSPDGARAVSGTRDDRTMKLWDADTGQLLWTQQEPGITVAISNDSSRAISAMPPQDSQ